MTKSKVSAIITIVLLPFMFGCASGGMKKPTVFADKYNSIPADITSQFIARYERFITGKEQKEFKKFLTDEERQAFIDKFWLERDTDPTTPENEYKQEIDDRIDDIASERFFQSSGTTGLLFRSNDGFRGEMAQVYMLHGEPDAMDAIESTGRSFVNLMLWVYINPENGSIRYAFLFYQKGGGGGSFKLFSQDSYQMDPCGALYEMAVLRSYAYLSGGGQNCPEDLYRIYNEIWSAIGKGGVLDGNIFAWALFNFSMDPSMKLGKALEPPKPASEIAKQSKANVVGEAPELTGTAGVDYILASCENCNSLIPAELSVDKRFAVSGPWKNFDWMVKGEYLELYLKFRIILQPLDSTKEPMVIEGVTMRGIKKKSMEENPKAVVTVNLLDPELAAATPSGTYWVSVYIQNTMTKKYNAWSKEITITK